jgi:hypothetical protein
MKGWKSTKKILAKKTERGGQHRKTQQFAFFNPNSIFGQNIFIVELFEEFKCVTA